MPQKGKQNADHLLLLALACGATIEGAARQSGLSEATVYRRLRDADFRRQIQELRADMVQRTAATLTAAGSESVKTLLALQQATIPHAVRLGAARAVLEMGLKLREAADLEQRLGALEQLMAQSQAAGSYAASVLADGSVCAGQACGAADRDCRACRRRRGQIMRPCGDPTKPAPFHS
jgi:hypothetical protein